MSGVTTPLLLTLYILYTLNFGTNAEYDQDTANAAMRDAEVDAVVAPTISYGMSLHHMRFPGSVTLRPTTLVSVVRDVCLLTVAGLGPRGYVVALDRLLDRLGAPPGLGAAVE